DDFTALQAGDYEYRVTALRCNDVSLVGGSVKMAVAVPPQPPPLTPDFIAFSPQEPCGSYPVTMVDTTTGPAPLSAWQWAFDGVPGETTPNVVHQFDAGGQHQVQLTVTDTDIPNSTATV